MDISLGGKPIKLFQELISNWSRKFPETYNWGVMLKILSSPTVGERRLANEIATKLKGEPYEGKLLISLSTIIHLKMLCYARTPEFMICFEACTH